ncbi:hypothetical protein ACTTAM_20185 (plasmid) [Rhodobacter capsulatus]|uniref:hypothetical protein n=1 Tax=Rhodobacter capsulatus TaxID=1061 RepID=UPI004024AEF4
MSKTVINLTVAVVLGTIATEMLMKKNPGRQDAGAVRRAKYGASRNNKSRSS